MDTMKKVGGKVLKKLGHGSDEDMRKDLQRKMGVPQTGKKPTKEEVEGVEEAWDDMLKDVRSKAGPQPSGGSGFKHGHRYGGSKQKDKPEQETDAMGQRLVKGTMRNLKRGYKKEEVEVDETFKGPEAGSGTGDNPFVTNENSPMNLAKDLAKKSFKKIKQETMMGKIAGGV